MRLNYCCDKMKELLYRERMETREHIVYDSFVNRLEIERISPGMGGTYSAWYSELKECPYCKSKETIIQLMGILSKKRIEKVIE